MHKNSHAPQPQNLNGKIVTLFGGTGFLGRYVAKRLAALGAQIIIPTRTPQKGYFLRPYGTVGQIVPMQCNLSREASVANVIENSDIVINLIGILFENKGNSFPRLHHKFPEMLARLVKKQKKARLIHVSAIGVDENSRCKYLKTKALGEQAVLDHMPNATILRPSLIFGPEDNFFNQFARLAGLMPFLPLIGGGKTLFQPVFVGDVADAITLAAAPPHHLDVTGKVFELGGPEIFTFRELMQKTLEYSGRNACLIPVPWFMATIKGALFELLPKPLLTRDQVAALRTDNIVGKNALTFSDLGLTPQTIEAIVPHYLSIYRSYKAA